jgi:enoyl-CoA hydratase/carnithine racemase
VNALGSAFVAELARLARSIARDPGIHVVAVASSLRVFCAGADLKERADASAAVVRATVANIQSMVRSWLAIPQPVLMLIDGAALGGGLEFALTGDIILASDDIVLGFPEVGLGIIPGAGGTQLLARRTNQGIAKKWILTGQKFSAAEALSDGVVDIVAPRTPVNAQWESLIAALAAQPPLALRQAKKAITGGVGLPLTKAFALERACYRRLVSTNDRQEALRAFLEKRTPVFTGT